MGGKDAHKGAHENYDLCSTQQMSYLWKNFSFGSSTTLQVLLGRSGEGGDATRIHRVELAAMMTVLSKFPFDMQGMQSEILQRQDWKKMLGASSAQ